MWVGVRAKEALTVEARQRLLPRFRLLLLLPLLLADAAKPPAMFVFGDSLSDVGNNNYLSTGFKYSFPPNGVDFPGGVSTGRFSNGYNIADVLARLMGFRQSPPAYLSLKDGKNMSEGINFASGGSGHLVGWCDIKILDLELKICLTMAEQLEFFRRVRRGGLPRELISESVFLFTSGSNDILYFYLTHLVEPDLFIDDFVAKLTSIYACQLKELYRLGARNFALINVPALGFTPIPVAVGGAMDTGIQDRLNSYARKFNKALSSTMDALAPSLEGMRYSIGDAYAAMLQVINHSQAYGMRNTTGACCGGFRFGAEWPPLYLSFCWPEAPYCADRGEYLFWDVVHPTQAACELAGEMFYSGASPFVSPVNFRQLVLGDDQYYSGATPRGSGAGAMVIPSINGARKLPRRSDWGSGSSRKLMSKIVASAGRR